jgi:hypothetical protein
VQYLGKLPAVYDPRHLSAVEYLDPSKLSPPETVDLTAGITDWPMYANDQMGDCTCAAIGHMIQRWSLSATGEQTVISQDDIVAYYRHLSPQDTGAAIANVLSYTRDVGLVGHKIEGFISVSVSDPRMVKLAAWLFEGLDIGVLLPRTAQGRASWDVVSGTPDARPGSWGGHSVNVVAVDDTGVTVVTWGKLLHMSWDFWATYVDEAWAILPDDFAAYATKNSPEGFDLESLRKDLRAL